jgi:hypothetical protein
MSELIAFRPETGDLIEINTSFIFLGGRNRRNDDKLGQDS